MSETNDNITSLEASRKLAEAVRAVKNAAADRSDVVIEMRDAERMRLELLANELAPVIADVPADVDVFDFAISSGLQPRLWIDSVAHVAMGRDKRSYRFVKDTRNGRAVLSEAADIKTVANAVTTYIAERMVERERLLEGGAPIVYREAPVREEPLRHEPASPKKSASTALVHDTHTAPPELHAAAPEEPSAWKAVLWGLAIFLLGGLAGFSVMATQWWEEIARRVSSL